MRSPCVNTTCDSTKTTSYWWVETGKNGETLILSATLCNPCIVSLRIGGLMKTRELCYYRCGNRIFVETITPKETPQ